MRVSPKNHRDLGSYRVILTKSNFLDHKNFFRTSNQKSLRHRHLECPKLFPKSFIGWYEQKKDRKKGGKVTPAKFLENPCFSLILAVKVPKSAYIAFFMDEGTFPPFFQSFKLIYVSHIEMGNTLGHFK